jgi:antirestriction protein ArdC
MRDAATSRQDIHRQITDRLIAAMEAGPGKFVLPWRRGNLGLPTNAVTGQNYNGINILALWVAAQQGGFVLPVWATYKQWAAIGAQVRAGERASLVVFYKQYDTTPNPDDADDTGRRRVARASAVFNAAQVSGYAPPTPPVPKGPIERLEHAEQFIAATRATISFGGDRAFYMPSQDRIQLPADDAFTGTATMDRREAYYATLVHELVHWTGAKHRLDRNLTGRFGTQSYAAEELVAELGAAFLCSDLVITQDVRPDHAQYLASWVQLLKQDSRAIFTAAARASEAANYLRALSAASTVLPELADA